MLWRLQVLTLSSDINIDEVLALEYLDLAQTLVGRSFSSLLDLSLGSVRM